mmetsp:Transcript_35525/g.98309  ORF Transcript_35525/g.98309 Transcript_35525/m.98309 type:complete len:243 (-) Transcript_35525:215-943(-)
MCTAIRLGSGMAGQELCLEVEAELRPSRFARQKLRRQDADGRKHGEAAVVELPLLEAQDPLGPALGVRVVVEDAPARGVAEVTHVLVGVLLPEDELEGAGGHEDQDEAVEAGRGGGREDAPGPFLDVAKGRNALHQQACRSHHRYAPVLQLGLAQLAEAFFVTNLGEAERVEEPERRRHSHLLRRVERRGRRRCLLLSGRSRSFGRRRGEQRRAARRSPPLGSAAAGASQPRQHPHGRQARH